MKRNNAFKLLVMTMLFFLSSATSCPNDEDYVNIALENACGEQIYLGLGYNCTEPFSNYDMFYIGSNPKKIQDGKTFVIPEISRAGIRELGFGIKVFRQSTLDTIPRRTLIENNSICDTFYAFSYEDLEKLNFKIRYTGK